MTWTASVTSVSVPSLCLAMICMARTSAMSGGLTHPARKKAPALHRGMQDGGLDVQGWSDAADARDAGVFGADLLELDALPAHGLGVGDDIEGLATAGTVGVAGDAPEV